MDIYYCGFNSFHHVPSCPESPTLSRLTLQSGSLPAIRDVAICWNFLALVDDSGGLLQYGLGFQSPMENRSRSLRLPSEARGEVLRISATPRHLLAVTGTGETWRHEEGKGGGGSPSWGSRLRRRQPTRRRTKKTRGHEENGFWGIMTIWEWTHKEGEREKERRRKEGRKEEHRSDGKHQGLKRINLIIDKYHRWN
ncbi:RCC1 domain containing 1 [Caligus rogercresseyi]|uniref:RCC1 domain containing 1 n=1 Tax=Caligus rogercresseyi TaxID=217165 RepID=A0A7T8K8H7_CALRO|nr:RCC1 domain containing 1 [Caligus rogercresseyi]